MLVTFSVLFLRKLYTSRTISIINEQISENNSLTIREIGPGGWGKVHRCKMFFTYLYFIFVTFFYVFNDLYVPNFLIINTLHK